MTRKRRDNRAMDKSPPSEDEDRTQTREEGKPTPRTTRRPNRRGRGKRGERKVSDRRGGGSQPSPLSLSYIGAQQASEMSDIPLGLTNLSREFHIDYPKNQPSVIYRVVAPYTAFSYGFSSAVAKNSSGETTRATAANRSVGSALFAQTRYAQAWVDNIWPIMTNLFESGVGARTAPNQGDVIAYIACSLEVYRYLRYIATLNFLTYHYDWSEVSPHTSTVPPQLYEICRTMRADDVGLASTWAPYFKRFENHIAFPALLAGMKRMMRPLLPPDLAPRVILPTIGSGTEIRGTAAQSFTPTFGVVLNLLDNMDFDLSQTANLMRSFLPFPVAAQDPWGDINPVVDPERWVGMWNSSMSNWHTFSSAVDTDVERQRDVLAFFEDGFNRDLRGTMNARIPFHTLNPIATWGEVQLTTLYEGSDATTDWQSQLTPHDHGEATLISDDQSDAPYVVDSDLAATSGRTGSNHLARYQRIFQTRFDPWHRYATGSEIGSGPANPGDSSEVLADAFGVFHPGLMTALIDHEAVARLVRQQVEVDFHQLIMKRISATMMGNSLREIRFAMMDMQREAIAVGQRV